jgi:hypothetical protein
MNFANAMQDAAGIKISAKQFLEAETASSIARSCAAQEKSEGCDVEAAKLKRLVAEFGINADTATNLKPELLEAIVRWFLDELWMSEGLVSPFGFDDVADWAIFVVTESSGPEVARLVGKAADAIEGRLKCRWGTSSPNVAAMREMLSNS